MLVCAHTYSQTYTEQNTFVHNFFFFLNVISHIVMFSVIFKHAAMWLQGCPGVKKKKRKAHPQVSLIFWSLDIAP